MYDDKHQAVVHKIQILIPIDDFVQWEPELIVASYTFRFDREEYGGDNFKTATYVRYYNQNTRDLTLDYLEQLHG